MCSQTGATVIIDDPEERDPLCPIVSTQLRLISGRYDLLADTEIFLVQLR